MLGLRRCMGGWRHVVSAGGYRWLPVSSFCYLSAPSDACFVLPAVAYRRPLHALVPH
ncbi:hypothetical protein BvRS1_25210 [Burkholderia vietnamiensis]|nr:hypothetical protein BvRS1_25210 [Burkholderia vietnamiensis]CAG9194548.1 hypothetical protein BVI2075_200004 [Burkholderia vietnamiensis]CAG9232080.1 hypothetical protein BVI1335_830004 [Burkholderia vietnamiensis]